MPEEPVPFDIANCDDIQKQLEDKPLELMLRCRTQYAHVEFGYHMTLHLLLTSTYAFADYANDRPEIMKAFYAQRFFEACRRRDRWGLNDLLKTSLLFMVGCTTGPKYERALTYKAALEPFWLDRASAQDVMDALEKDGVDRLYRAAVENRRKNEAERPDVDLDGTLPPEQVAEENEPKPKPRSRSKATSTGGDRLRGHLNQGRVKRGRVLPGHRVVEVQVAQHDFDSVMNVAGGKRLLITTEPLAPLVDGEWRDVICDELEIVDA